MPVDPVASCRAIVAAMVTDLNTEIARKDSAGTAITQRFTAKVNYYPEYNLPNLNVLQVDVRYVESRFTPQSRNGITPIHDVEITIQQAMRFNETDAINLLVDLSERIGKFYAENCEPCGADATNHASMVTALGANYPIECVSNTLTVYDPVRLRDYGHFWSMLALSWEEQVSS